MTNRFLMTVAAAALMASTGLASAQAPGGGASQGGAAGGGSTMQQGGSAGGSGSSMQGGGAGSERGAPSQMNRDSAPSGGAAKGAQNDRMEGGKNAQPDRMEGTKGKSAQDDMKGQKSQHNTASDTDRKGGKDMKAEGQDRMGKDGSRNNAQTQDRDNSNRMNADSKNGSQTTTGQAGAGAKLSSEQRTQISTTIKQQNVAPVTNVNFNVSIGTRVPRDVSFHVLPSSVVTIYPQWRGYKFVMVREEIVIVDPNTYEIVEIIRI